MIGAPTAAWMAVSATHGTWWGIAAASAAGLLSVVLVALFYRLASRLDERALQRARAKYRDIYRVIAIPTDPTVIVMPAGAEIRVGDYGWEAGPSRNDGLIYLQGLTPDWTVVWHLGFHRDEIEKVSAKTHSQYDAWHPYWAAPPPLPPCPFPVLERETMTAGRPDGRTIAIAISISPPLITRTKGSHGAECAQKATPGPVTFLQRRDGLGRPSSKL